MSENLQENGRNRLQRVGDLARRTGKTVRAIHLYEELGLLHPQTRSSGGFRLYDERAVERVRWIDLLHGLGFSLQEMRGVLEKWWNSELGPAVKDAVQLRPLAAQKEQRLLMQSERPDDHLRIGVRGGGCSGNSYFMQFAESAEATDEVIESHGVKLVVDPKSAQLLAGTVVDFVEGLMGTGFKFNNPNVRHSCACGESFSA